jgi:hypothetical protein
VLQVDRSVRASRSVQDEFVLEKPGLSGIRKEVIRSRFPAKVSDLLNFFWRNRMKKVSTRRFLLGTLVTFLAVGALSAQDIPVRNWTVPQAEFSKSTHLVGSPMPFSAISPPCRLDDSRVTSGGPGPIPGSGARNYDFIGGGSGDCGTLPSNVVALSLMFTVVGPLGPGFIYAYPTGAPPASPVSIINYNAGELRNNAAIVPVDPATGSFTVTAGVSGTDLIIDINGVFYNNLVGAEQLAIFTTRDNSAAILGQNNSNVNGTHGVGGFAPGTGIVHGVQGQITSAAAAGSSGVHGIANAGAGRRYGVLGESFATTADAAGVFGIGNTGLITHPTRNLATDIGVFGESRLGYGVVGQSEDTAGIFVRRNTVGTVTQFSWIASSIGTDYAFYASTGDYGGSGAKYFVEPHRTDPTRVIKYIAAEGPEAMTFFRGTGKCQSGLAAISVPEHFRMVTDEEGLTVSLTPKGAMATLAAIRVNLDRVTVQCSRNIEFYYLVQGIRRAYKGFEPVQVGNEFMPPSSNMELAYSDEVKRALISNGILREDGKLNMETARNLGWDKIWAENGKPVPSAKAPSE